MTGWPAAALHATRTTPAARRASRRSQHAAIDAAIATRAAGTRGAHARHAASGHASAVRAPAPLHGVPPTIRSWLESATLTRLQWAAVDWAEQAEVRWF